MTYTLTFGERLPDPEQEKRAVEFRVHGGFVECEPRVLCFDLENRPLAYWYDGQTTSEITAFGWKWRGEDEVHTLLLRRDGLFETNDGTRLPDNLAYEKFVAELVSADLVYGHYIRRHDLPMLNAGLLRRQMPLLPAVMTTDTQADLPRKKDMSASLASLASMYGLGMDKQHMTQPDWEQANRLEDDGIALARSRVTSDVLLQERLRNKLLELGILKQPRVWRP